MGLLSKLFQTHNPRLSWNDGGLVVRAPSVGQLQDDLRIYRSLREVLGASGQKVSLPYKQSTWVYACINAIADNISRVPFKLKKDIGAGAGEPADVEEGALYDLFQNPNPYMTQEELFRATMIYLGLKGECIWILDGRDNLTQVPKGIWVFDPSRFEPWWEMIDGQRQWIGWEYKAHVLQKAIYFYHWEVIHLRYFNPYHDIRGMSPIEASQNSIDQDYYASQYNKAFFENGATIGGFISVDGELNDDQYSRIVKQFEDRHKGAGKAHKIFVVEGGGKFQPAKISQKDMDFIEGKKLTREEIFGVFKVNEVVLGIYKDIKSYEGIRAAHKAFWEECLMPKVMYLEGVLWSKLFSKIGIRRGKGRIWGQFDLATVGALQTNYSEKVDTAGKMAVIGWPINAINKRLELGMPDVKWGDMWFVPGGYVPVTALLNLGTGKPQAQGPKNTPSPVPAKEVAQEDLLQIEYSCCAPLQRDFRGKMKKFLFGQRKQVLAAVYDSNMEGLSSLIASSKNTEVLFKDYRSLYYSAMKEGVNSLSGFGVKSNGAVDTLETQSLIDQKAILMATSYSELSCTLIEALKQFIVQYNPPKEEIATKVRAIYNVLTQKSNSLARLESEDAYAYGRWLAVKIYLGDSIISRDNQSKILLGGKENE